MRNPLRSYFAGQIETKALAGPNPAADLKFLVGKGAHKRARSRGRKYFAQEEGPQLIATARALYPRWAAFILTGLLAGLRWGESAALRRSDIDWSRGRIHVQRTVSDKGRHIEPCKDGDGRWVKASPALLTALRAHTENMALEGSVSGWTPEQREFVFSTAYGNVVAYPYFLEHVWQPLLAKAGLPYRPITRRGTRSRRGSLVTAPTSDGSRRSLATPRSRRPPTPTATSSRNATRPP